MFMGQGLHIMIYKVWIARYSLEGHESYSVIFPISHISFLTPTHALSENASTSDKNTIMANGNLNIFRFMKLCIIDRCNNMCLSARKTVDNDKWHVAYYANEL